MFDKRSLLRKLKNNKILVLAISVIVVSAVYYGIDKAIDFYNFKNNSDIDLISDEEGDSSIEEMDGADGMASEGDFYAPDKGEADAERAENGDIADVNEGTENVVGDENDGISGGNRGDVKGKIYIYITGEVNAPGVVMLNEGSRIVDAINASGGTTEKANISKVNLVYVLEDGMKINIPNNDDLKNNSNFEYITKDSGDGTGYYNGGVGTADDSNSGGSSGSNNGSLNNSGSNVGRYEIVNINTATQTELESLPGIGPSLALKIISYRKENGKFSSIDEIKNVSGIGESKFEELKKYIKV